MRIKLVVSALLAFLIVVFVSQNNEIVQVTFLAWSVEMPLLLMIFVIFGAGIIIGWLLNSYFRFSRQRKRQHEMAPAVEGKIAPESNDEEKITEGEREEA